MSATTETKPSELASDSASSRAARCYADELERTGGRWLAAAREWLQWHTKNGEHVHWGSNEEIIPTFTVAMVENLAASVAAAAINEERDRRHNAPHEPSGQETQKQSGA